LPVGATDDKNSGMDALAAFERVFLKHNAGPLATGEDEAWCRIGIRAWGFFPSDWGFGLE